MGPAGGQTGQRGSDPSLAPRLNPGGVGVVEFGPQLATALLSTIGGPTAASTVTPSKLAATVSGVATCVIVR